jgi:hypothetical protein
MAAQPDRRGGGCGGWLAEDSEAGEELAGFRAATGGLRTDTAGQRPVRTSRSVLEQARVSSAGWVRDTRCDHP